MIASRVDASASALRSSSARWVVSSAGALARLAEELQLAILTVLHLNKSESASALNRIGGSVGFRNAARSVLLLVARDTRQARRHAADVTRCSGAHRVIAAAVHKDCDHGPELTANALRD